MSFDNRIFNINGEEDLHLETAIKLAFQIESNHNEKGASAKGYIVMPDKGLVFLWYLTPNAVAFAEPMYAEDAYIFAKQWLAGPNAKNIELNERWEGNCKHDGSNGLGWRVYVEDWGHIGTNHYAICAIKPCYVWYGK
jgi:hypothetical protein